MDQLQPLGVQEISTFAWKSRVVCPRQTTRSINRIARERMPNRREMNSNLMRSPGSQPHGEQSSLMLFVSR
jgi:hypothetical protein